MIVNTEILGGILTQERLNSVLSYGNPRLSWS